MNHTEHLSEGDSWRRTLYILFFAQLMVAVGFSSIFPFLPLYVEQLGSSTGLSLELLAGLVYSAQSFTMMLASPIWGALADHYGRKLMVERSMFGGALILLLMAFVTSAEQLVLLRAVQGMITGTVAAANALLASVTPARRTGYAMGLLQVGFGTGLAAGPLIGGAVADAFDYHSVFFVTATLLFLAGLVVLVGVHETFHPAAPAGRPSPSVLEHWRTMLGVPGLPVTYLLRFLASLGRMMVLPILPLFIQDLLVDPTRLNTFTGLAIGIASGATTLSSVFLGRLGDRVGYRKVLAASLGALAGLYVALGYISASWQLLALQVCVGMAVGGVLPTISALLANYSRPGEEGAVFGLDNSINAAGRTVAPLLSTSIAAGWGYPAAFVSTGVVLSAATLLAASRLPPSRR